MARSRTTPGSMRHLVSIHSVTRTSDSRGGVTEAWAVYVSAYCSIVPKSGREAYAAGQEQSTTTHTVTTRYQSGIRPRMRIVWGTRTLLIESVRVENEENRLIVMDCIEERV